MRLITRLPIKRKYEIGDTFHFPNIILKEYRDNTVQNAHSFIFCVAVLTNIDKVTIRDENDKIVSSELFTISCEKPTPLGVGWIALYLKNNSK